MTVLEALILGLIQGLTEFLPVSSSGHIELGKVLLGTQITENLTFSVLVHGATVLSILVIFYKDINSLLRGALKLKWNEETKYLSKIVLSMVPVGIVGFLFEEQIESIFTGRVLLVGIMLLVTASILFFTLFAPKNHKKVGYGHALLVGMAQTIAVLPGISRSGTTIGTGLLLGIKKEEATRFSFLMVLLPILGASVLKVKEMAESPAALNTEFMPMLVGFLAAFISGLFACKWMLNLVRKGKIAYFSIYCALIGIIAIITAL